MCDNLSTTQRDEVEMSSDTNQWGNWEVEMSDETIRSLLRIKSTSLESSGPLFAPPEPPNSTTVVPDNALSPEQTAILKLVQSGRSIFFTGSAGTGKSVLLRAIIHCFREKYATLHPPQPQQQEQEQPLLKLAITASTGIASVNIDGCTLHSWAGIGLGKENVRVLTAKLVASHRKAKARESLGQERQITALERWKNVRTLIIDEISMIDPILFDKLVCSRFYGTYTIECDSLIGIYCPLSPQEQPTLRRHSSTPPRHQLTSAFPAQMVFRISAHHIRRFLPVTPHYG
ncbi:hypothetical protein C8Q72DRAFT_506474 [Fomitopsis betulina]|nr:hypothetical protein C8Q72DRAFT_506474 [Fomitopsis betulina]